MICRTRVHQSGFTLIEIIITVVIVAILGAMILTFLSKSLVDSSEPIRRLRQTSDLNRVMANITADYYQYPKWRSLTDYSIGNRVLPINPNGRYYTCVSAGKSDMSEPNWSDTPNMPDGTVRWDVKPWSINPRAGMWKISTNYLVGDVVMPTIPNGHFYRCKTAGMSGATEPTSWPKDGGSTISDGGVVWTRLIQYVQETVGTPDSNPKSNGYGQCPGINCVPYYVITNKFIKFVSNGEMDIVSGERENILKITIANNQGATLTALFISK
jgi:prepilin-type N-terminal cleavage/methylation domain-containing protein